MAKKIPDTSDMPKGERISRTLKGLMGQNNGCIEAQEAQGQCDLIASAELPVDGTTGDIESILLALGFTLGPIPDGDIFRPATLPPGWSKVATDHSMHSNLLDENGHVRAGIFYKAAFYDRSAHIRLRRRFACDQDYDAPLDVMRWIVTDAKSDKPIHTVQFDVPPKDQDFSVHYDAVRALEKKHGVKGGCRAWLTIRYPNWTDPAEYWTEKLVAPTKVPEGLKCHLCGRVTKTLAGMTSHLHHKHDKHAGVEDE